MSTLPIADLTYYPDTEPGLTRRRRGRGFSYYAADGTHISDQLEIQRFKDLAIPPAYEDVWISPLPHGHLQATGRDARRRKQYRYHPDWAEYRALVKFEALSDFGRVLPTIRKKTGQALEGEPGDKTFAVAAIVALLDRASLRMGSKAYTRENGSFGATTLRSKHMTFDGTEIRLTYAAKGGKRVRKRIADRRLNKALQAVDELPGAELVSWIDDDGNPRRIESGDVREWLSDVCGTDVTPKTFRTWNGTREAFEYALGSEQLTIKAMSEAAGRALHNSPTIARNSYIHPKVIGLCDLSEADRHTRLSALAPSNLSGLRKTEAVLLSFLE